MSTVLAAYDYKYQANVWRGDVNETFQASKRVKTEYTVVDGQVVKTVETTWEFASAIAERSVQLPDPPTTFLYVDSTYRKDRVYIFQKTHIKTTTYSAYGDGAYLVVIDDLDVLTGINTHTTSIIDGKIPLAPTVGSSLSNLIQQPITEVLDDNCDSIDKTITIDSEYLQDESEGAKLAKRRMQRETAIVRRVKHGVNPLMKIGHTIQVIDPKRSVDGRHVLLGKHFTMGENGAADEVLEMEFWTR